MARASGFVGIGFSYTHVAAAHLIDDVLADQVRGRDAMAIPAAWEAMAGASRNLGRQGICATAIAAVDTALWDLKARLLGVPLVQPFGQARPSVPVYGSGGFTSMTGERLAQRLRDRAPPAMDIAAGEYGYDLDYVRRMLDAGAVDVLQLDATRCALAECRHVEFFYDHMRIEEMLFEGALQPQDGAVTPELGRPGNGLAIRDAAARYQVYGPAPGMLT